jgi:hypothetical protein
MPYFGFDEGAEAVLTTHPPYTGTVTTLPPLLSSGLGAQLRKRLAATSRPSSSRAGVQANPLSDPLGDDGLGSAQVQLRGGYLSQLGELGAGREGRTLEVGHRLGFRSVDDALCNTGVHGGGLLGPLASPYFIQVHNTGVGGKHYTADKEVDAPEDNDDKSDTDDDDGDLREKTDEELIEAATDPLGGILTDTAVFAQTFSFNCHKRVLEVFHSLLEEGGGSEGMSVGAIVTKCLGDRLDDGPQHPTMLDAYTAAPLWPYPPEDRGGASNTAEAHEDRVLLLGGDIQEDEHPSGRKQSVSFAGGGRGMAPPKPKSQREVTTVLNQAMTMPRHGNDVLPCVHDDAVASMVKALSAPARGKKRQSGGGARGGAFPATAYFHSPQHHLLRYCRPSPRLLEAALSLNELQDRYPTPLSALGTATPCESALSERYVSVLDVGIADRGSGEPQHTPPFEALGRCLFRMLEQDLFEHGAGRRPFFQLVSAVTVPDAADGTVKEVKVYTLRDLIGQALAPLVLAERRNRVSEASKRLGGEDARRAKDALSARVEQAVKDFVGSYIPPPEAPAPPSPLVNSPGRKSTLPSKLTEVTTAPGVFAASTPYEDSVRFGLPQTPHEVERADPHPTPPLPSTFLNDAADDTVPMVCMLAPNHTLVVVDVVRTVQRGSRVPFNEDLLLHRSALLMPADAVDDYILGMAHDPHFDFDKGIDLSLGGATDVGGLGGERGAIAISHRPSAFAPTQVPLISLHHGVVDTTTHPTIATRSCREHGVIGGVMAALKAICEVPRVGGSTDVDSTATQEAALIAHLKQVAAPAWICEEVVALRRWIDQERNDALVKEASGDTSRRGGGKPLRRVDTSVITPLTMLQYLEQRVDEHRYGLLYDASSKTAPPLPVPSEGAKGTTSPTRHLSKQPLPRSGSSLSKTALASSDPIPSFLAALQDPDLVERPPALSPATSASGPTVCSGSLVRHRVAYPPVGGATGVIGPTRGGQPAYLKHLSGGIRPQVSTIESNSPWAIQVYIKKCTPPPKSVPPSAAVPVTGTDALLEYAKRLVGIREAAELARRLGNPVSPPAPPITPATPSKPPPDPPRHALVMCIQVPATHEQPAQQVEVELPILGRTSTEP